MAFSEHWTEKKTILVALAHPDDPEFFCGATIARWTAAGHEVHYLLITKGDKGSNNVDMTAEQLMKIRQKEQRAAAEILRVKSIRFLDKLDGYIMPDLDTRREVIRSIRELKADIVVSCDPANLFSREGYINHPDHRIVGQMVIDAIYPGAGNRFFFPELLKEGLDPWNVQELWLSIPDQANTIINVTDTWDLKIQALAKHVSQIGSEQQIRERMKNRRSPQSTRKAPVYEEKFKRIIFK